MKEARLFVLWLGTLCATVFICACFYLGAGALATPRARLPTTSTLLRYAITVQPASAQALDSLSSRSDGFTCTDCIADEKYVLCWPCAALELACGAAQARLAKG